jgi:hypothetical protein
MTDPDPGGPKTYGTYGSGHTTLWESVLNIDKQDFFKKYNFYNIFSL